MCLRARIIIPKSLKGTSASNFLLRMHPLLCAHRDWEKTKPAKARNSTCKRKLEWSEFTEWYKDRCTETEEGFLAEDWVMEVSPDSRWMFLHEQWTQSCSSEVRVFDQTVLRDLDYYASAGPAPEPLETAETEPPDDVRGIETCSTHLSWHSNLPGVMVVSGTICDQPVDFEHTVGMTPELLTTVLPGHANRSWDEIVQEFLGTLDDAVEWPWDGRHRPCTRGRPLPLGKRWKKNLWMAWNKGMSTEHYDKVIANPSNGAPYWRC